MRLHIAQLAAHCQSLGLAVDSGKDFVVVWLGPRLQPRVVRRTFFEEAAAAAAPRAHGRGGARGGGKPAAGAPKGRQQQQQHGHAPPTPAGAAGAADDRARQLTAWRARLRRAARAPFALVAYRHGAVVLLGPPAVATADEQLEMPDADAAALSRAVPLGAFYRSGVQEGAASAGAGARARAGANMQCEAVSARHASPCCRRARAPPRRPQPRAAARV